MKTCAIIFWVVPTLMMAAHTAIVQQNIRFVGLSTQSQNIISLSEDGTGHESGAIGHIYPYPVIPSGIILPCKITSSQTLIALDSISRLARSGFRFLHKPFQVMALHQKMQRLKLICEEDNFIF